MPKGAWQDDALHMPAMLRDRIKLKIGTCSHGQ